MRNFPCPQPGFLSLERPLIRIDQHVSHERTHQDLAREVETWPAATLAEQAERLERWRVEYNNCRPHEALGMKTPAEVYCRSERKLKDVQPYVYPPELALRRVARNGCIQVGSRDVYISGALKKMTVGLERLAGTGWRVWFCGLLIREIDPKQGTFRRPEAILEAKNCNPCPDNKVLPMSRS